MTRGQRTLLVVVAVVVLGAGGLAWYWQATAVDRQVNVLLDEVRTEPPGLVERWLMKLGLAEDRRTGRGDFQVADDLAKLGPSAVPELIRALRDTDVRVKSVAAWALGELREPRGVQFLIAALKDQEWAARFYAVRALGQLGDARAVEPLEELLRHEAPYLRDIAAQAIEQIRRRTEGEP